LGLRFDPMGGGQFKQAIKQIMDAERQPIKQMETRKAREESRLKLFSEFKAKFTNFDKTLADLNSFQKFRELKADLGDGTQFVSVSLDKERAQPGSYTIEVTQLAERSSIMTNGFESPDEPVLGTGFVVVQMPDGETAEIFVEEDKSSLRGVADMINKQANYPARASVMRDSADPDAPWKLILAAKGEGSNSAVIFPEFYFLDGDEDLYIEDSHDAQNAMVKIDGFPVESETNEIKDFLQGVNLNLKGARPEQPFTLTITQDYQKVGGKMKGLVEQVNGILEFINKQNQVDDKSDTRNTFTGDTGLSNVEYRLRNLLHEGFPVAAAEGEEGFRFINLGSIGVEFEKNGLLAFKEDKFNKAMEKDFDAVAEVVTGRHGLANQLRDVIAGYTRSGNGFLAQREAGFRTRIRQIDDQIAQKEKRLTQREQALTDQFSRLQGTLANMQRQQQYLSANMNTGGGGNLLAQLMGSG
jgi:flagellar hook-associated protein 2